MARVYGALAKKSKGGYLSEYLLMFAARLTQIISWLFLLGFTYAWITYSLSRFPLTYPLGH